MLPVLTSAPISTEARVKQAPGRHDERALPLCPLRPSIILFMSVRLILNLRESERTVFSAFVPAPAFSGTQPAFQQRIL